jgi:hypothetical protein
MTALLFLEERIIGWWQAAYRESIHAMLADRFVLEATASLPGIEKTNAASDDIFSAVNLQRLRLRHDQQVPEWSGPG